MAFNHRSIIEPLAILQRNLANLLIEAREVIHRVQPQAKPIQLIMSSIESKTCDCSCQRSETGECVCVCSPPCAAGKTVEWTCNCNCEGTNCRAKFQLRCNRQDGSTCPADCERNVFSCKCKCTSGECTFEIRKCPCCEVVSCECGDAPAGSEGQTGSCCGKGKCC